MSDKDQFTFEDEDESPESSVTKKEEPQEPDAGGGEIFFDTEEASRRTLRSPTKAAKIFSSILKMRIRSLSRRYRLNLIQRVSMRAAF
jgi:Mor family transcriptional regulator